MRDRNKYIHVSVQYVYTLTVISYRTLPNPAEPYRTEPNPTEPNRTFDFPGFGPTEPNRTFGFETATEPNFYRTEPFLPNVRFGSSFKQESWVACGKTGGYPLFPTPHHPRPVVLTTE